MGVNCVNAATACSPWRTYELLAKISTRIMLQCGHGDSAVESGEMILRRRGDGKRTMRFWKFHGIGNDYIYVDCVRNPPPRDPVKLSQTISDRHFGIGSDGLILICPSERA